MSAGLRGSRRPARDAFRAKNLRAPAAPLGSATETTGCGSSRSCPVATAGPPVSSARPDSRDQAGVKSAGDRSGGRGEASQKPKRARIRFNFWLRRWKGRRPRSAGMTDRGGETPADHGGSRKPPMSKNKSGPLPMMRKHASFAPPADRSLWRRGLDDDRAIWRRGSRGGSCWWCCRIRGPSASGGGARRGGGRHGRAGPVGSERQGSSVGGRRRRSRGS